MLHDDYMKKKNALVERLGPVELPAGADGLAEGLSRIEEFGVPALDQVQAVCEELRAGILVLDRGYRMAWANHRLRSRYGEIEGLGCHSTIFGRNEPCPGCGCAKVFRGGDMDEGLWTGLDKMDIMTCRNVLMYFSDQTARKAPGRFRKALEKGGRLVLGHSEIFGGVTEGFTEARLPGSVALEKRESETRDGRAYQSIDCR